jgi:hypothetical protein
MRTKFKKTARPQDVLVSPLSSLSRDGGESLRIDLHACDGRPYLKMYVWHNRTGCHQTITIRMHEIPFLRQALQRVMDAHEEQRPTEEPESGHICPSAPPSDLK